jgi:hypothetical protein
MNAKDKKRLIWNAVPTKFDVPNPPPAVTPKRRLPAKRPVQPGASVSVNKRSKVEGNYF